MKLSLRWRIAAAYALLLVGVLTAASGVIAWRIQTILYDYARARVDTTMREIVAATQPTNPFDPEDSGNEQIAQLLNGSNLAQWQSATTFVQVDTIQGYPVARTPNLGGSRIPPNADLTLAEPSAYRTVFLDSRPFLVEDRLLHGGSIAAVVHVAEPLGALEAAFAQAGEGIALIIAVATLLFIGLSIALASQISGPIVQLSRTMREIGSDRLELLPESRRTDEIGELNRSFNDLLLRLQEAFARERQFISDASHELKTPLTSINANAQLLLRWGDREPEIRRESLETIERESASLAQMVNGMLTLAKADRGDDIPKEPLSLSHLAQDVARATAPRAAEKGLELRFQPPLEAQTIIVGDPHLIRQLIANLVDNAIKFTPSGAVRIDVGSNEADAWVEVGDSGPGIPEAELANVFERFYRADRARSREVPGTGLGLAIVRSIARVHGGTISASRAPEGGALFRATFPRLIDESLTALS